MFVIAGASGRVGKVVTETLLSRLEKVRVIVRKPEQAAAWSERGAEVAVGSLQDSRFLEKALAGAKGFFALLPDDPFLSDFHGVRRSMADAMARAVEASRVPHTVFLSAIPASKSEGNGPPKDLHYAEKVLARTSTTLTIIRSTYFQDNAAAVIPAVRHEGVFPVFVRSADEPFPMIATRDVGRFAARCLVEPPSKNEIVDLIGPPSSMRDVATKLGALLGRNDVSVVLVPAPARVDAFVKAGLPRAFAESLAEMYAFFDSDTVQPVGDRLVATSTTLDETLASIVRPS
jgi:uncharacterized protein YbjT (DUF2867 family)